MWYYKVVNKFMLVKGEKKFIVRFYKPKLFSHYTFAEDDRGCCWDVKDCKKIKGEKTINRYCKKVIKEYY